MNIKQDFMKIDFDKNSYFKSNFGTYRQVTLSTSVVVFLSTPVWCSLPSPYGPSLHLRVVAPPQCFLSPPPLCGFLSPLLWRSFSYPKLRSHTQILEFIPINLSHQSFPTFLPQILEFIPTYYSQISRFWSGRRPSLHLSGSGWKSLFSDPLLFVGPGCWNRLISSTSEWIDALIGKIHISSSFCCDCAGLWSFGCSWLVELSSCGFFQSQHAFVNLEL